MKIDDPVSVPELCSRHVPTHWNQPKSNGNTALASGDIDAAVQPYTAALEIAMFPTPHLDAFRKVESHFTVGSCSMRAIPLVVRSWAKHHSVM